MKILKSKDLKINFNKNFLKFGAIKELEPLRGFIGQKEAERDMEFGLSINSPSHHIFVSGVPGSGRTSMVMEYVEKFAKTKEEGMDVVYVYSFEDPFSPKPIFFKKGEGKIFKKHIEENVQLVLEDITRIIKNKDFLERKQKINEKYEREKEKKLTELSLKARKKGVILENTPQGFRIIPVYNSQKLSPEEILALPVNIRRVIENKIKSMRIEIERTIIELENINSRNREEIREFLEEMGIQTLAKTFPPLFHFYKENKEAVNYIKNLVQDIIENLDFILTKEEAREILTARYTVHLFLDRSSERGAPIVLETHPTPSRLIGRIERKREDPTLDFTGLIPGAFHRANGGFLIIPAEELLKIPASYTFLKWTLKSGKIFMEMAEEEETIHSLKTIKPQPVPFNGKIILIGTPSTFFALKEQDEDFREFFKVHVEFKTRMDFNYKNVMNYARFVKTICKKENLLYPDLQAFSRILWFSTRLSGDRTKLSTNFGAIADILREGNHIARQKKKRVISGNEIKIAISRKIRPSELEKIFFEWIRDGIIVINFEGKKIGEINGLAVLQYGDTVFGRPVKISATVSVGKEGIIDIEREAELSGPIHIKGTQILRGYLGYKYGQKFPLYLSARVVFEQTYEGVEGDSASAAELVALLSSISKIPVKQNIAITGSINQKGEIQAVGGINEKIEGLYMSYKFLKPKNKVIAVIPFSNIKHLSLREEIIEAVDKGEFGIIAVRNIDEAIEILFDKKAHFVHKSVEESLKKYHDIMKKQE